MEKRPFFSVIIPIYNAEKTLAEAVHSVLAQTFADFEILLVDDASTDGSREAALAMAREDSRVQVVLLQKNRLNSLLFCPNLVLTRLLLSRPFVKLQAWV